MAKITLENALNNAVVAVAEMMVGVHEFGGNNRGYFVERFQKAVDGKAHSEPWCMSFAQWCCGEAYELIEKIFGQPIGFSKQLYPSEHCMTVWNKTPEEFRLDRPKKGSLIIWQKWRHDRPTSNGHVGIVVDILSKDAIRTIEGNTSDSKGVIRDGQGVYLKTRYWKHTTDHMQVKGFLMPW